MKKTIPVFVFIFVFFMLACGPLSVVSKADGALDYAENAPGGVVTDVGSFLKALGTDTDGRPNAELVAGTKSDIRLRSSVILASPVIIVTGEYRLIGGGCTVARGFSIGPMIVLDGSVLGAYPKLTLEKPYDREPTDGDPSLVFNGNSASYPEADGAMIAVIGHASLTVNGNVLFTNASAINYGAAIYVECGSTGYEHTPLIPDVDIRYCKFTDCRSLSGGGAVAFNGYSSGTNVGTVNITGAVFKGNSAENDEDNAAGGAVWSVGGELKIAGCGFDGNRAEKGGAIYTCSETSVVSSAFENNESEVAGAAIYCGCETRGVTQVFGVLAVNDINLVRNKSYGNGGVFANEGVFVSEGFYATENEAAGNGGVIWNKGSFAINDGSGVYNKCSGLGGAVYNEGKGSVFIMNGGEFGNNKAAFASAVYSEGIFKMAAGAIGNNKGEGPDVLIKGGFVFGPTCSVTGKNTIGLCITRDTDGVEYQPYIELNGELKTALGQTVFFCSEKTGNNGKVTGYSCEDPKGRILVTGSAEQIGKAEEIFAVYGDGVKNYRIKSDGSVKASFPWWIYLIAAAVVALVGACAFLMIKRHKKSAFASEKTNNDLNKMEPR